MNFEQVDWLVAQWALWTLKGDSTVKKLSESRAKWQDDYVPPRGDGKPLPVRIVVDISDDVASTIDRVMAAMLHELPNVHYRIWCRRAFRKAKRNSRDDLAALDAAHEQFVKYFHKVLSKSEQMSLNTARGRPHA